MGRDSSVGTATRYGLDGPGIESRWGARVSPPVLTPPGAYPDSCTMGTGSFPGVKRRERGADHPPPSKCRGQERVGLYLYSPSGPQWPVIGWTIPLLMYYSTNQKSCWGLKFNVKTVVLFYRTGTELWLKSTLTKTSITSNIRLAGVMGRVSVVVTFISSLARPVWMSATLLCYFVQNSWTGRLFRRPVHSLVRVGTEVVTRTNCYCCRCHSTVTIASLIYFSVQWCASSMCSMFSLLDGLHLLISQQS